MRNIPVDEQKITDAHVFEAFDLNYPGLQKIRDAVCSKDYDRAKKELVSYFHTRNNVSFVFDYRGMPRKPVSKQENIYLFQASIGLQGELEDFVLSAAEQLMENIYILPGGRNEPVHLGANFETAPHFNCLLDEGKRNRTPTNMFTRGQWMEYLFVLYQNSGNSAVAEKLETLLQHFWKNYSLKVEDTAVTANRFQYTEDRTVMSVGWLAISYLELLYTEMVYAVDYQVTFEVIKHLWFLGVQFTRFNSDSYRPYNHHMWERGLMPFVLGTMFPEIPEFVDMKSIGAAHVQRHVIEEFDSHGGYSEYSVAYWSGAALGEMLFRGMYLARLNGEELLDEEAEARIYQSFQALVQITLPCEHYPSVGDGRGPLINPVLSLGDKMLNHKWCQELLQYRTGVISKPPFLPLYYSDDTVGFTCGRTGFEREATCFLMSTRVNSGISGHNHMDMLSLGFTVRGETFMGEPYTGHIYPKVRMGSPQRGYLHNMTAHNTVLAYGKPIAEDEMYANQWGMFRPDSPVTAFQIYARGMYAAAMHDGYSYCRHERKILFAENGNMMVRDEISPGGRTAVPHVQRWHLMTGVTCKKLEDRVLILEKNGVRLLCIWNGAKELRIWKDSEVLCPEMYPSEELLGYNIDITFETRKSEVMEETTVFLDVVFADITNQDNYQVQKILNIMPEANEEINQEEILERLIAII